MCSDETSAIMKLLEHVIKVNYSFAVLEDYALTKSTQLPKYQNHEYFPQRQTQE